MTPKTPPVKIMELLSPTPGCKCETCEAIRRAFKPYLQDILAKMGAQAND